MRLQFKLLLSFIFFFFIALSLIIAITINFQRMNDSTQSIVEQEDILQKLTEIECLMEHISLMQIYYEESHSLDKVNEHYEETVSDLQKGLNLTLELQSKEFWVSSDLELMESIISSILTKLEKIQSLNGANNFNEIDTYFKEIKKLSLQFSALTTQINQELAILHEKKDIKYFDLYANSESYVILFFVFGIILTILNYLFLLKNVAHPMSILRRCAEGIREGNFHCEVNLKTKDEFEELGHILNESSKVLGRLNEEKKEIDEAKTNFLSITSHELRSPMTPILAQLEMLVGGYFGNLNPKQKESLKMIARNTSRLDDLIQDLLEISRIEAARLKFNFSRVDLKRVVNHIVFEMKNFMPEKNISITTDLKNVPIIECDSSRVSQVLRNLIENAIKFTPKNGKVIVGMRIYGGQVLFYVKDNGVGIPLSEQNNIFYPFYQARTFYQHESGGTGLGLAISKGIVESQNGKIWVASEPNKGSTFYFTIPVSPVVEVEPIKLLFVPKISLEDRLKSLFSEILGPIWEEEFTQLKLSGNLTEVGLNEYIEYLEKNNILNKQPIIEFKKRIDVLFKR